MRPLVCYFLALCFFETGLGQLLVFEYPFPELIVSHRELNEYFDRPDEFSVECKFDDPLLLMPIVELRLERGKDILLRAFSQTDLDGPIGLNCNPTFSYLCGDVATGTSLTAGTSTVYNPTVASSTIDLSPISVKFTVMDPIQSDNLLGLYVCRAIAETPELNRILRPMYLHVESAPLDIQFAVRDITDAQSRLQNFSVEVEPYLVEHLNFTDDVNSAAEKVDILTSNITDLLATNEALRRAGDETSCLSEAAAQQLEALDIASFVRTVNNETNTTYLLSQFDAVSFQTAQPVCNAHGGYLAEIDDQDEFNFVTAFLDPIMPDTQIVLFSGIWESTQYVTRREGTALGYTEFFFGATTNGNNPAFECLGFFKNLFGIAGLKMYGAHCQYNPPTTAVWRHTYLCEIPDSGQTGSDVCSGL